MPSGFKPRDPEDPGYHWGAVDQAVNAVHAGGLKVILTVTGSGPVWGTEKPKRGKPRVNPDAKKFADFATATATRYGSKVDTYIVWNEPNINLWMQPQATCVKRRCTPHSPHQYRKIVLAAVPALTRADPGAKVLIGALAPAGTTLRAPNNKVRPLEFLRAFACVDKKYRPIRTGECKRYKAPTAYGFAYHPHGILKAPSKRSPNKDDAQMADLSRVISTLDKLTRKRRVKTSDRSLNGRFGLYLTEYGYQTRPPDRILGVSASLQSTYLQQAAFLAAKQPRVRNMTQYVWIDERGSGSGWQSGMRYFNGTAKLALRTFPIPFWAQRRGRSAIDIWGQVRPGDASSVQIQRRNGSSWMTITTMSTNSKGYYSYRYTSPAAATLRAVTEYGTTSERPVFVK
jgi:hypothetical protein